MDFNKTICGNKMENVKDISKWINKSKKIKPYAAIPITGICQFNCIYCRKGGEVTLGKGNENLKLEDFKFMVDCAIDAGIEDFRITGGEPFLHKDIISMIKYLISRKKYVLVNTNGMIYLKLLKDLEKFRNSKYLEIVVSLDSLDYELFDKMTGSKGKLKKALESIVTLKEMNLLKRINMVITKLNYHGIDSMIEFCKKIQTNLSLLESISVPLQNCSFEKLKTSLEMYRLKIENVSDEIFVHEYTRNYGVPVLIYKIDDIFVSFKSLLIGGQYSTICKECDNFPCYAGLHHIKLLPDFKISLCRWKTFGDGSRKDFRKNLNNALEIFLRGNYFERK